MGGRLSRKRRGYNVNDPKESKSAAESTDQPEVKQDEPESKDVSKEQLKTPEAELPDQQPDEAPKVTSETTEGNQTDSTVTIEGKAAIGAQDHEAVLSSEAQESATCTNSVKATEQPSQEDHQTTKAEIESSSSAEVHVPVSSEETTLSGVVAVSSPNGEAQEKPVLPSKHVNEGPNLPTEKLESDHAAPKIMENNKQLNSSVSLDVKVQSGQVPEGIAETSEQELTKTQDSLSEQAESSDLETKSEPGAENVPHETETPKLSEITEETPIDLVLKNEVAKCADLQKNLSGPGTMDEVQEKMVSKSTRTAQVVADLKTENSDHLHDGSVQGVTNKVPEDQGQLLEGSGNLSVDTLREESVTDLVPVELKGPETDPAPKAVSVPEKTTHVVTQSPDPIMAECAPGTSPPVTEKVIQLGSPDATAEECSPETLPNADKEISETRLEQTPEMSHQDRAEIALLNSSSEKIPAIKLTVYTEALQEEKIEMDTELMTKESPNHFDTKDPDPDPQNEMLPEKQSTSCLVELISDQEVVKVGNTSDHPVSESQSSSLDVGEQSLTDQTKTEATVPTENVSVVGASSQIEKTSLDETPIANGTPLDTGVGDFSKSMSKELASCGNNRLNLNLKCWHLG
eukprot:g44111.t1